MAQFSVNATRFDPYKNFKFRVKWDGRYVAGPYADNLSGDTWVADAAIDIINEQDGTDGNAEWSGLWITFSAIDKVGHMWGGGAVDTVANYGWTPGTLFEQVHMPWAAKTADDQLGRVIAALKAKGEFNDTLIVVTADHGETLWEREASFTDPAREATAAPRSNQTLPRSRGPVTTKKTQSRPAMSSALHAAIGSGGSTTTGGGRFSASNASSSAWARAPSSALTTSV